VDKEPPQQVNSRELEDRVKRIEHGLSELMQWVPTFAMSSPVPSIPSVPPVPSPPVPSRPMNTDSQRYRGSQQSAGWINSQNGQGPKCYQCKQNGHIKRNCPMLSKPPEQSSGAQPAIRGIIGLDNADVYLAMDVGGKRVPCLLDSGCEITLVPLGTVEQMGDVEVKFSTHCIYAANGTAIQVAGEVELPMVLEGRKIMTFALASPDVEEIMLGIDWLRRHRCVWDFDKNGLYVDGYSTVPLSRKKPLCCRRVYLQQDVILPPQRETDVVARATITSTTKGASSWAVESRQLKPSIYVGRTLLPSKLHELPVRLINTASTARQLKAGTFLGSMSPVEVILSTETDSARKSDKVVKPENGTEFVVTGTATAKNGTDYPTNNNSTENGTDDATAGVERPVDGTAISTADEADYLACLPSDLTEEQRERAERFLSHYTDIFSMNSYDVGRTSLVEQHIDTGNNRPIRQPLRRHPIAHLDVIDQQVRDMLEHDLIEPAASPWASNVVLVRKKDGTYRFCVDYRAVNAVTYNVSYPLPHIDTCLNAMNGSTWFSTLDLRSGYHNIPIREQDRDKTAFITRRGCWRYKVMPFGLTCAPSVFQRLMDLVLCGLSFDTCMVYLDDIIIFAKTFDEHLLRLEQVFGRLRWAGLKLRLDKCSLLRRRVSFLGHIVSKDGIEVQNDKVTAVQTWPVPHNLGDLRSFVGLCSYYRRFIAGFADVSAPLHALTRKHARFTWGTAQNSAFEQLKQKLTTSPVLGMPTHDGTYYLDTDASDIGLGAVLSQDQDGTEKVIAYASRTLDRAERNYCVTRRELLAVVFGLKTYKQFLLGRHFIIRTDHSALQ